HPARQATSRRSRRITDRLGMTALHGGAQPNRPARWKECRPPAAHPPPGAHRPHETSARPSRGPPSARRLLPRTANLLCQSCGMNAATPVVLVVEDEPEIATQIVRRLEAEGWTAHSVGDGLAGVEAAT